MKNKTVLVTGADGQLGMEFQVLSKNNENFDFIFTNKTQLPVEDEKAIELFFSTNKIDFCINCAAYTAVDKAESEKEKAFLINATAVGNLARVCNQYGVKLIHISTDYVFPGWLEDPYLEIELGCPLNVYGSSKLKGEKLALSNNSDTIIIRTSWLFSSYGNNFVKTMVRLMKEKESINVVNDQFGCPTYAADLVKAVIKIITDYPASDYSSEIYHFCNDGVTTWYEFAIAIKEIINSKCIINPILTDQYPTAVERPKYSVLDTNKIKNNFHLTIPHWKDSLKKCIMLLTSH